MAVVIVPPAPLSAQILNTLKTGIMTAGRIGTDVDCVSKISTFVRKIIETLGVFFGIVSTGLKTLVGHLASVSMIAEFVEPIKRLYQLTKACNSGASWANKTGLGFAIGARTLGAVNLLHKFGVIDVAGFASTIGTYAITPIAAIGLSFEATSNAMALHSNPSEFAAAQAALELANFKLDLVEHPAAFDAVKYKALHLACANAINGLDESDKKRKALEQLTDVTAASFNGVLPSLVAHAAPAGGGGAPAPIAGAAPAAALPPAATLLAKLRYDVTRWTKEVVNTKINKLKSEIGLIASLSKVIFMTLGFIGFVLSVSAIAFSTPLMIALGLVVGGIAVTKVVFDKHYDDSVTKIEDQPVEVAAAIKAAKEAELAIRVLAPAGGPVALPPSILNVV